MLVRIGKCNHCGQCCKPPVVTICPCKSISDIECRFFTKIANIKLDIQGHCLIHGRTGQIEEVKDYFGQKITKEQIQWYNDNCLTYPTLKDAEKGYVLPKGCGFKFVEAV
jgi:hypothetical protein